MAQKIKTILFDLGGVYLNRGIWIFREDYLVKNFNVTNQQVIDVMIKKYYKPYFSGKMEEEEFWGKSLDDLNIKADWKDLRKKLLDSFEPQKGMPELVKNLRNSYTTGLLSDQTKEWWPYLNNKYKISDNFDFTIISYKTGFHKPQSEIYDIAIKESGRKPDEILFIDDLEHNLLPAKNLGMKTLLFENPIQIREDLKKLGI